MNRKRLYLMLTGLVFMLSFQASALTALPMKITVQTGDTLEFAPFIQNWNGTDTNITMIFTAPTHGTVEIIPHYFVYDTSFNAYDTSKAARPTNFPGIRYVPQNGFTGRDSFVFKVKNSTDSTNSALCRVMVHPPEPGNMTVLLVVNQVLKTSIETEVNRLKTDLEDEGYTVKVVSFADGQVINGTNAKLLWNALVTEYDNPNQMVAGAILIGNLPYYSNGTLRKDEAFWCMSKWMPEVDADTTLKGLRIGKGSYRGAWYTPAFPNIWVTRMWGTSYSGAILTYGTQADLVKRILQADHDYRTGACRLPHKAFQYDLFIYKNLDHQKYLDIWSEAYRHRVNDSIHPFKYEFRQGGELWDLSVNGNADRYVAGSGSSNYWIYFKEEVLNTHVPIRFLFSSSCHTGTPGSLVNFHLLARDGGCVLAVGPTDYTNGQGQYSLADTSKQKNRIKLRKLLAQGERWGRAWIRANMSLWCTFAYGDMSLKPKMAPSNEKPIISAVTAEKTGSLSWHFTATASDPDGSIDRYEWYSKGYDYGKKAPDTTGINAAAFDFTYASSTKCTVRVEVVDNYKARDYWDVIIKTDSGVISTDIDFADLHGISNAGALSIYPNPFNPVTMVKFVLADRSRLKAWVVDPLGKAVRTLCDRVEPAGVRNLTWDGRDNQGKPVASGIYYLKLDNREKKITKALMLIR